MKYKKKVHIPTKNRRKKTINQKKDAIARGKELARKTLELIKPIDLHNELN